MRRRVVPAALAGAVLMLAGSAAAQAETGVTAPKAQRTALVKLVEIRRDGRTLGSEYGGARIYDAHGRFYSLQLGHRVRVPVGTYSIVQSVATLNDGITLFARRFTVSRDATLTLDARQGRPVRVGLDVPGKPRYGVWVCIPGVPGALAAADANLQYDHLYVVPTTDRGFASTYTALWGRENLTNTKIDYAGPAYAVSGNHVGLPAGTLGTFRRSALASWTLDARSGVNALPGQTLNLRLPSGPRSCGGFAQLSAVAGGYRTVAHVSAGTWEIHNDHALESTVLRRTLAPGGSYRSVFNEAVRAPSANVVPAVVGGRLLLPVAGMLSDPATVGPNGSTRTQGRAVLRSGGTVVSSASWKDQSGPTATGLGWSVQPPATLRLPAAGWYTLDVDARAYMPDPEATLQPGMLCNRATLSYRFHADPAVSRTAAVFTTNLRPAGLDLRNRARARSLTTLTVHAVRAAADPKAPLAPAAVRSLRLWASYDGGRTWHSVTVRSVHGQWTAQVRNPGSGTVALRTEVVSTSGNSTTETVYRAWAVH